MDACFDQPLTAIVKPTYACNLGCLYCYEGGRSEPCARMTLPTLENVIRRLAEYHGSEHTIHIIWHGGEPLLMGIDFYRSVVQMQSQLGADFKFENSIQTNATLLDDEFLEFLAEHEFSVGTSLDGPQWLHDFTRPYADGRSSFKDILGTLDRIRAFDEKPSYRRVSGGVIAVLTKPILAHLDEFYEFFRENSIPVKIIPVFYVGNGATVREKLGITPKEYGEAMVYLFDRWYNEKGTIIDIDPFDLILGNLITRDPFGCQFGSACYDSFVAIAPNGDVYPCGRWSDTQPFCLGNLNEQDLHTIRLSPILTEFRQARLAARMSCSSCEFHAICNSGCIENAYIIRQRLTDRDYYCGGYKQLFHHLQDVLMVDIEKATVSNTDGEDIASGLINVWDKTIDLHKLENPNLVTVLERRVLAGATRSTNYSECKETTYFDHQRHEKYGDWHLHREYQRHQRYEKQWRDHKYPEHSQSPSMC